MRNIMQAAVWGALIISAIGSDVHATIFAATGQLAPGISPAVGFGDFIGVTPMNNSLSVGFSAFVGGRWSTFTGPQNGLSLVVREGQPALGSTTSGGVPIEYYGSPRGLNVSDDGTIGFSYYYENVIGAGSLNYGHYVYRNGTLNLVAKKNAPAGTLGGASPFSVTYLEIDSPMKISATGRYAYAAQLGSTGITQGVNDWTLWTGQSGSQELIFQSGAVASGTGGGRFAYFSKPTINSAGNVAYLGSLREASPVITSSNNEGVWLWNRTTGVTNLVIREGTAAPGTSTTFGSIRRVSINSVDQLAVTAGLVGGVGSGDGIWTANANGSLVQMVASRGMTAPGTSVPFNSFDDPAFVSFNTLSFRATLISGSGSTDSGIWAKLNSTVLTLIAREGEQVPGFDTGTVYAGNQGPFHAFNAPMMNSAGDVAFSASLAGAGVNSSNDMAIFVKRANGEFLRYARKGDYIQVENELHQIIAISFGGYGDYGLGLSTGGMDGAPRYFANDGSLIYYAKLDDGRSVLATGRRIIVVPEVGGAFAIGLAAIAATNRHGNIRVRKQTC